MSSHTPQALRDAARLRAQDRLLDLLLPRQPTPLVYESPSEQEESQRLMTQRDPTREKLRGALSVGRLDDRIIELEIESVEDAAASGDAASEIWEHTLHSPLTFPEDGLAWSFRDYCLHEAASKRRLRHERLTVRDAWKRLEDEELTLLVALADLREESHQLDADASRVAVVQDALLELLKSDPSLIHSVSHRRFEEVIFELMERLGFRAELTARTRDGGCDVIAFSFDPLGIATKYVIEAKHYRPTQKVGVGLVRQLNTVRLREQAHHGILVTSSFFTRDALRENRAFYGLHLHDFSKLGDWLRNVKV